MHSLIFAEYMANLKNLFKPECTVNYIIYLQAGKPTTCNKQPHHDASAYKTHLPVCYRSG